MTEGRSRAVVPPSEGWPEELATDKNDDFVMQALGKGRAFSWASASATSTPRKATSSGGAPAGLSLNQSAFAQGFKTEDKLSGVSKHVPEQAVAGAKHL